ncbi:MAG: hypothetical protein H0W59_05755 [Chloroflexia bacterium]|nr:hypothetical protein [Chloroflexia bacterium]
MTNPFSWEYLTTLPEPEEVFDPFGIACLVIFGLGFLVAIVLYNDGGRRFIEHPVHRRLLRKVGGIGTILFGLGLFFFGVRALQINPFTFGLPLWLWLSLLAVVGLLLYAAFYLRTIAPAEIQRFEQLRLKQRYLRPVAASATTRRPSSARTSRATRRRR